MLMPWLLGLGLVILLFAGIAGAGAVNLSLRLGVPALIVSLTIVAFGTSAPELLISVKAILDGVPGLALGNVVGSNTANILMVLGIPALLATMHTSECSTRKTYNQMIAASLLFIALAFRGVFDWIAGLILLAGLVKAFDAAMLGSPRLPQRRQRRGGEGADPDMAGWQIAMFLILGLIGLPLGASLLVDNATIIAQTYGVSDTVIGLTLVAVGTSLPELATTVMAALRRQADVALGNVIGSNMFNLLAIIGIASLVGPISVDEAFLRIDLWVMLGASLLLMPFVYLGRDITRLWGVVLSALYGLYLFIILIEEGQGGGIGDRSGQRLGAPRRFLGCWLWLAGIGHLARGAEATADEIAARAAAPWPASRPRHRSRAFARAAKALGGPITCLVNNASIFGGTISAPRAKLGSPYGRQPARAFVLAWAMAGRG